MRKLEINITKATLKSFRVELADGKPRVSATIALLTDGGKQITDYTISTDSWQEKDKFDLPLSCIGPIVSIAKELEAVVTEHCRDSQLGLGAGIGNDAPINLEDIPF